MPVSDRLQAVRERAKDREKERERKRQQRRGVRKRIRDIGQSARDEATATVEEAKAFRDANVRDVVAVGGSAAASAARSAAGTVADVTEGAGGAGGRRTGSGGDDSAAMFARAEENVTAAPVVDATLDPVTTPHDLDSFVTGNTQRRPPGADRPPAVDDLVTGGPAEPGGMEELVMGGHYDSDAGGMDSLVLGDRDPEAGTMEDLVMGIGGDE